MRNIIVTGGELFNKGAQSMMLITVSELTKRFPNHKILVLSPMDLERPEHEKDKFNFQFIGWFPTKFARAQRNAILRFLYILRHRQEFQQCEMIYRNCDMMVDISGYALGSNWDAPCCNVYLEHLEFAEGFGIPVCLMPQSFGPFDFGADHPGIDARCRKLLPTCKAILAREQEGYDALVNTYGLTNVRLAPDLVLNNKGIDLKHIFREISELRLPEIAPNSIAVVPNGRNLSVGSGEAVLNLYRAAIRQGLKQGKTVYLLHHATSDAKICAQLKEQFEEEKRVVVLEQEFSCLEFNELVKRFDYLVASRFHSIVHAYKNGVPCITLGWAKKYEDLLAQFEQGDYLFDVRNSPNEEILTAAMERLNGSREKESATILSHLADVQQDNVFDVLTL